jgi:hypothetical protein
MEQLLRDSIAQRIEQLRGDLLRGVMKHMIRKHGDPRNCPCEHCNILRSYLYKEKDVRIAKKSLESEWRGGYYKYVEISAATERLLELKAQRMDIKEREAGLL